MQQPWTPFFSWLGLSGQRLPLSEFKRAWASHQTPNSGIRTSRTKTPNSTRERVRHADFPTAIFLCLLLFSIPRPAAVCFVCGRRARGFTLSFCVCNMRHFGLLQPCMVIQARRWGREGVKGNAAFFLEVQSRAGLYGRCRDGRYTRVDRSVIKAAHSETRVGYACEVAPSSHLWN